jgi:hypothetical protein
MQHSTIVQAMQRIMGANRLLRTLIQALILIPLLASVTPPAAAAPLPLVHPNQIVRFYQQSMAAKTSDCGLYVIIYYQLNHEQARAYFIWPESIPQHPGWDAQQVPIALRMGIGANSVADNGSYIPKSRAEQNRPGSNTAATGLFKEAANSPKISEDYRDQTGLIFPLQGQEPGRNDKRKAVGLHISTGSVYPNGREDMDCTVGCFGVQPNYWYWVRDQVLLNRERGRRTCVIGVDDALPSVANSVRPQVPTGMQQMQTCPALMSGNPLHSIDPKGILSRELIRKGLMSPAYAPQWMR